MSVRSYHCAVLTRTSINKAAVYEPDANHIMAYTSLFSGVLCQLL